MDKIEVDTISSTNDKRNANLRVVASACSISRWKVCYKSGKFKATLSYKVAKKMYRLKEETKRRGKKGKKESGV